MDAEMERGLPEFVVCPLESTGELVLVRRGMSGWTPMITGARSLDEADRWVLQTHGSRTPTTHEREAALFAAMFGWDGIGAQASAWERREQRLLAQTRR